MSINDRIELTHLPLDNMEHLAAWVFALQGNRGRLALNDGEKIQSVIMLVKGSTISHIYLPTLHYQFLHPKPQA